MKKVLFLSIAVISLLICSCSGKTTKVTTSDQDSTNVTDTTVVDTMVVDSIN